MDRYCTESSSILGEVHDLTGKVAREGKYPCAHGGFADVWKGMWRQDSGDRKVSHPLSQRYYYALTSRAPGCHQGS